MNRRAFIKRTGILAGGSWLVGNGAKFCSGAAAPPRQFKAAVISDGLSEDFESALKIMQSYGIRWVEIRSVFGKYNTEATPEQIRRIKELLAQYRIRCSQVDTALYKCTLPGTTPLRADKPLYPYSGQMDLLKRAADRAHAWGTNQVRVFGFWRVAEPAKIFDRVSEELSKAAEVAKSAGVRMAIENEDTTNIGTVRELAEMLRSLPANVGANYDIGNGMWLGEVSYPDGYKTLDPKRIWNVHLKGAQCGADFKGCHEMFADEGQIDLKGQLRALLHDHYRGTVALECEFEAPGMNHSQTTKRSLEGLLRVMNAAVA